MVRRRHKGNIKMRNIISGYKGYVLHKQETKIQPFRQHLNNTTFSQNYYNKKMILFELNFPFKTLNCNSFECPEEA